MSTKKRGGQPGNSNAAKGRRLSAVLRKRLEEREEEQKLMDVLLDRALGGDMVAIKEVFDRIDGKVKQAIVGGDDDDPPLRIARIELVPLTDDNCSD